jgi:hypothetical protein
MGSNTFTHRGSVVADPLDSGPGHGTTTELRTHSDAWALLWENNTPCVPLWVLVLAGV